MSHKRLIATVFLTALAGSAIADDVWIKRSVNLRSDQSAAGDVVSAAGKGEKAVLLERSGNWVKVDVKGKVGWVSAESISTREVRPDMNLAGKSNAADMTSGAAMKGNQPIADEYAQARNLKNGAPDQMIAIRKTVTARMLKDFTAEGKIQSPGSRPNG